MSISVFIIWMLNIFVNSPFASKTVFIDDQTLKYTMIYNIIFNLLEKTFLYYFFSNHYFWRIWLIYLPCLFELIYIYANMMLPLIYLLTNSAFSSTYDLNIVMFECFAFLPVTLQIYTFFMA